MGRCSTQWLDASGGRSQYIPTYTDHLSYACCLNRPFGNQTQDRIRLEAEAVLLILGHVERGERRWIGSEVLDFEIQQMPDAERRRRVQVLTRMASGSVRLEEVVEQRGSELEAMGFGTYDALHLVCAEQAGADVFLTTDDRLLRRARRDSGALRVRVGNPLVWLNEATERAHTRCRWTRSGGPAWKHSPVSWRR